MSSDDISTRRARNVVLAVAALIAVAGTLRCAATAVRWDRLSQDPDAYRRIAENLVQRGVYSRAAPEAPPVPTAYRPPLYPLVLAATAWRGHVYPWNVAVLHVIVGSLTVLLAWLLARAWQLGRASWLAAALLACDPILLNQASEVMTETLATLLAVASLLALTRLTAFFSWKWAVGTGVTLGLAVLCRPTFLVWAGLCGLYVIARWRTWSAVKTTAVLACALTLVLAPWGIRNRLVLGRAVVTTTHGGYTLLLANNRYFYNHLRHQPWGSVWDAGQLRGLLAEAEPHSGERPDAGHGELDTDRRLYELAVQTIRDDPVMFGYACAVRVARLWTPLPHRLSASESGSVRSLRWLVALWYFVVYALAVWGGWRLGRHCMLPPWVWGLLAALALTMVHSVYWSNMRMRAPVMPVVYLAVAAVWAASPRITGVRKLFDSKRLK